METKIIVLCNEKDSSDNFITEHGLSILVESENNHYLFDTGQTDTFIKNAENKGISLDNIKNIIISHGHYDHLGGLKYLREKNVYIHNKTLVAKYKKTEEKFVPIGADFSQCQYELNSEHTFIKIHLSTQIDKNAHLITNFKYNNKDNYFFVKKNDEFYADNFEDEIVLVIDGTNGLDIITGCSHCGIVNIVKSIIKKFPDKQLNTLVGGFHLAKEKEETVKQVAQDLKAFNIKKIIPLHCSGNKILEYLV